MNIKPEIAKLVQKINFEAKSRAFRAANELRNSELNVLRGRRSGRVYRRPFTKQGTYRASAPGEPPAVRSGDLRRKWKPWTGSEKTARGLTVKPAITTDVKYAPILEEGYDGTVKRKHKSKDGSVKVTAYHLKIAPRPFKDRIVEGAKERIKAIYSEPYLNK